MEVSIKGDGEVGSVFINWQGVQKAPSKANLILFYLYLPLMECK